MTEKDFCKHVIIRGRVQGVGYRAWTAATARKLELRGWVRNLADGSVEALLAGSPEAVEAMLLHFHKGPLLAKVTEVTAQNFTTGDSLPEPFITLPTAGTRAA